jgi:hypothetical protein
MKRIYFLLLIFSYTKIFAQHNIDLTQFTDENGVLVANGNSGIAVKNFYSNGIFSKGKEITYGYRFYKNEDSLVCRVNGGQGKALRKDWVFSHMRDTMPQVIHWLTLKAIGNAVDSGRKNKIRLQENYYSKRYNLLAQDSAMAVENEANVWMQFFNDKLFAVSAFSPFPFAKFPLITGETWKWEQTMDDSWSDERFIVYHGPIDVKYQYRVVARTNMETKLGNLPCYVITSIASSRIGEAFLIAYYNTDYGFVLLEFHNIDGSELIIHIEKTK